MRVSEKEELVMKNMAWFVGRSLSYIDVTIDSPDASDKYSKKNVLKKLFEKDIYDVRNKMFKYSCADLIKDMDVLMETLIVRLTSLILTAIPDQLRRDNFIELIRTSSRDMQTQLIEELRECGDE